MEILLTYSLIELDLLFVVIVVTLSALEASNSSDDNLHLCLLLALCLPFCPLPQENLFLETVPAISHLHSLFLLNSCSYGRGMGIGSFSDVIIILKSCASAVDLGLITVNLTCIFALLMDMASFLIPLPDADS